MFVCDKKKTRKRLPIWSDSKPVNAHEDNTPHRIRHLYFFKGYVFNICILMIHDQELIQLKMWKNRNKGHTLEAYTCMCLLGALE